MLRRRWQILRLRIKAGLGIEPSTVQVRALLACKRIGMTGLKRLTQPGRSSTYMPCVRGTDTRVTFESDTLAQCTNLSIIVTIQG
jgi:hypothetical protein